MKSLLNLSHSRRIVFPHYLITKLRNPIYLFFIKEVLKKLLQTRNLFNEKAKYKITPEL